MQFTGFTKEAFSAYAPEKWSSNVHNLPRMRNKDLLVAVCQAAQEGLEEELTGLSRAASDEIPSTVNQKKVDCQWVYWFRDAAARANLTSFLGKTPLDQAVIFNIAPQEKHITLAVILDQTGIWIGLRLGPLATIDRRNLATKLGLSWEREHMLQLLAEVPQETQLGFLGDLKPVAEQTSETLQHYSELIVTDTRPFVFGCTISAEDVVTLGDDLIDHVHRWLGALAPLYHFAAWSKDNDLIDAGKQIQEEKAQKRRQSTAYQNGDKVRVTSGLFSGKIGIVQEIDTKAQVKVLIGKMSVVLAGKDLTPA